MEALKLNRRLFEGVRILVVDDAPDNLFLVSTILSKRGAQVVTAVSAGEGIVAFDKHRPHIVVSDLGMPDEDGFSFMRKIETLYPAERPFVRCVSLTAYALDEYRKAAIECGFDLHLAKPIEPNKLVESLWTLASQVCKML